MKLKPDPDRPGLIVRDPVTGNALPARGAEVSGNDPYWRRRLRVGDVESATLAKPTRKAQREN